MLKIVLSCFILASCATEQNIIYERTDMEKVPIQTEEPLNVLDNKACYSLKNSLMSLGYEYKSIKTYPEGNKSPFRDVFMITNDTQLQKILEDIPDFKGFLLDQGKYCSYTNQITLVFQKKNYTLEVPSYENKEGYVTLKDTSNNKVSKKEELAIDLLLSQLTKESITLNSILKFRIKDHYASTKGMLISEAKDQRKNYLMNKVKNIYLSLESLQDVWVPLRDFTSLHIPKVLECNSFSRLKERASSSFQDFSDVIDVIYNEDYCYERGAPEYKDQLIMELIKDEKKRSRFFGIYILAYTKFEVSRNGDDLTFDVEINLKDLFKKNSFELISDYFVK